jgi:hypothetical protein
MPLLALLLDATPATSQTFSASDTAALILRIEASRPAYRAGDSINLRLTVRNALPDRVEVPNVPLMELISLRVFDAAGNQLPQGGLTRPPWSGPSKRYMGPWDSVQTWINLRDWGYDIQAQGRYTVVGIPPFARDARPPADTSQYPRTTITVRPMGLTQPLRLALILAALLVSLIALGMIRHSRAAKP